MYYSNYDDYMRDVFYFNQTPAQNFQYPQMGYGSMYNPINGGMQRNQNLDYNQYYPSIYKIIKPVVSKVVSGNNYQYITEDNINSMVDTVYNIVEGDVQIKDESDNNSQNNKQNTSQIVSNSLNTSTQTQNKTCNSNNSILLKDLIKILVINEIISRNRINFMRNNQMNNCPMYFDCCNQRCMF